MVVRRLLQLPEVEFNSGCHFYPAPLPLAIQKGDIGIVRLLLAQGKRLDINKQHSEGLTALSPAVRKRSLPIIDLILHDSRVNPNITDNQGRTALWWAKLDDTGKY
jgi:ankyrin repeat protein